MSEDEFWDYINRPKPHPINKDRMPLHFNTKEEYYRYYSDAVSAEDAFNNILEEYGC